MKQLFTTAGVLFSMTAFAQVGINNTSPKATLDITAKTSGTKPEGLIIPQLTGDQIHTATITASPAVYNTTHKGLIIYATSADSSPTGATTNITAPGYYYFDGSVWQKIVTGSSLNTSLNSGNIYVGNASNVATAVTPSGDVTISNTGVTAIGSGKVTTTQIADGTVANADLANMSGLTVKGNSTNAAAAPTDIAAGTDGYVLRRSGTALGFGTVATAGIADNAVTVAKLPSGATATTFLRGDGTWVTPTDTNTTYTAGTGLSLSGTTFSATDASTSAKGIVQLAGDLSGTATSPTVAKIQNKAVSSTAPSGGQVLKYNSTTSAWEPAADADTNYTAGTGLSLSGTTFSATDASTSAKGIVQLAGDLAGTAASPTVAKIQNNAVSATAPTSGQVLGWNGTAWAPTANGISTTLNSGNILVGNASNVATAVTPSGDVTISNTGVTAIGSGKVTTTQILDGTVANADLANMSALTVKGNATNAAAAPTDIAAGTDGYVLRRSGTALAFGTVDTAGITDGAVTSNKILDATVANADLASSTGGIYKGDGSLSGNTTVAQNGNTLAFTSNASSGTSHFTIDGTTLNVDAVNNRVGIGVAAPKSFLHVSTLNGGASVDAGIFSINNCWLACSQSYTARNIVLNNLNNTNPVFASIDFVPSTDPTAPSGSSIQGIDRDATNNYAGVGFWTRNSSGYGQRMVVKSAGNVGIGTSTPQATLDVNAVSSGTSPEGIIAPRLSLTALQGYAYGTNQTGAMVYVNSVSGTPAGQTANVTAVGYYYFDGSNWQKVANGASVTDATTTAKGIVQLAGDLAGTATSPSIANSAVTSTKIADGAVTAAKLNQMSASSGQVLGWNGTAWAPTANGVSTTLNSGNIYVGNASNVATSVTPSGDVTISNAGVTAIGTGKVTSSQIADGTVANADLNSGVGGIYKGSGSLAGNTTVTQGTNTLAFTTSATNGFSVNGSSGVTAFSVDGAGNKVGIGTAAPITKLDTRQNPGSSSPGNGAIAIGETTQVAGSVGPGAIRYSTNGGGTIEYSNGTAWNTLTGTVKKSLVYGNLTDGQTASNGGGTFSVTESFDQNNDFASNVFTVPRAGNYSISLCGLTVSSSWNLGDEFSINAQKNGVGQVVGYWAAPTSASYYGGTCTSVTINAVAGDLIKFGYFNGSSAKTIHVPAFNKFSIQEL